MKPNSSDSSDRAGTVVSRSVFDTAAVAGRVAALVAPGDVVLLDGPLGAGKTTFARELAAALGTTDAVTSPTYTLVHEYRATGGLTVAHLDLYRLETMAEIDDLGLDDLLEGDVVVLVEWGGAVGAAFGPDRLEVELEYGPPEEPDARRIALRPFGAVWTGRLAATEAIR